MIRESGIIIDNLSGEKYKKVLTGFHSKDAVKAFNFIISKAMAEYDAFHCKRRTLNLLKPYRYFGLDDLFIRNLMTFPYRDNWCFIEPSGEIYLKRATSIAYSDERGYDVFIDDWYDAMSFLQEYGTMTIELSSEKEMNDAMLILHYLLDSSKTNDKRIDRLIGKPFSNPMLTSKLEILYNMYRDYDELNQGAEKLKTKMEIKRTLRELWNEAT